MSRTHRPHTPIGRVLARLTRRPVTRIPQWDNPDHGSWPAPDMTAARARVSAMIEAHIRSGSPDEAHGDIADRITYAVTNVWRLVLYDEYLDRHQGLEEAHLQGQQHQAELEQRVQRATRRRATAAAVRDQATFDLIGAVLPEATDLNTSTTTLTTDAYAPALRTHLSPPTTVHTTQFLPPPANTTEHAAPPVAATDTHAPALHLNPPTTLHTSTEPGSAA